MKNFTNGFESWQQTHYEIVVAIVMHHQKDKDREGDTHHDYDVARMLTDEFEIINKDRDWECGDYWLEIEEFATRRIKQIYQ